MACLGQCKITCKGARLPAGFVTTIAREDLLVALKLPYYRVIVRWRYRARGRFSPVWLNAIKCEDVGRVEAVLAYEERIAEARKIKRKR